MNVVVRWRIVHPAKKGPKISCSSSVVFEELVDGVRDRVRSCGLDVWPSLKSKLEDSGVEFEQLPDVEEPPCPPAKSYRSRR